MKWRVAALLVAACAALAASALAATSDRGAARAGARWLERAVAPRRTGRPRTRSWRCAPPGRCGRRGSEERDRLAPGRGRLRAHRGRDRQGDARPRGVRRRQPALRWTHRHAAAAHRVRPRRPLRPHGWDHALGMLAFRALGQRPPQAAIRFLRGTRGSGGWNFTLSRSARDEVSHTALAILALRAAGVARSHGALRAAARWMRAQRTRSGGYAHRRRDRNEANSTALAILAQRAMGARDPRAVRALRALQRPDGAFQFTATDAGSRTIATTDAVLALSGRVPPVGALRRPGRGC